jgi:hypothetical protein
MGMDVVGRNPSSPAGKYFGANLWSWRPIQDLIVRLCSDLLDDETLVGLGYNDGQGPKQQATCTEMATQFERWMEHHVAGHQLDLDLRVTKDGEFVTRKESAENPGLETESAYRVDDETLKEWIEFLRHCGGFEVW